MDAERNKDEQPIKAIADIGDAFGVLGLMGETNPYYLGGIVVGSLAWIALDVNQKYFLEGRTDMYHVGYGGLDNNGAGLMLAMGFPMCIFAAEAVKKWWRWGFVLSAVLIVHGVMITYSRGAMGRVRQGKGAIGQNISRLVAWEQQLA